MKVDLSKCNVGDKVVLRDGRTADIIEVNKSDTYPIAHDSATSEGFIGYHACDQFGKSCIGNDASDIVGIKTGKHENNYKTAKCFVEKQSFVDYELVVLFASFRWVGYYASKRNAIRGAKRFCATIGFECDIVKEESNV